MKAQKVTFEQVSPHQVWGRRMAEAIGVRFGHRRGVRFGHRQGVRDAELADALDRNRKLRIRIRMLEATIDALDARLTSSQIAEAHLLRGSQEARAVLRDEAVQWDGTQRPYDPSCYRCEMGDPCSGHHQTAEEFYGLLPRTDGDVIVTHTGCDHPGSSHSDWGCAETGCPCQLSRLSLVWGPPPKRGPADDDTAVMATVDGWSAEGEAASFLADDDAQRRRADR